MTKNSKSLTEKDIPIDNGTIDVLVEGHQATIEIYLCTWSPRLKINFKDSNPKKELPEEWADYWEKEGHQTIQSKYFLFEEPGILIFGKDEVRLKIVRA